jgi:hypothetical protein
MPKSAENKLEKLNGEYKLIAISAKIKPALYKAMRESMERLGYNNETSIITVALTKYIQENG